MRTTASFAVLALFAGAVLAKLPPLSDEAKAKAAEAAAKAAYGDKVAGFQLCKSQDKVAAEYLAAARKAGKDIKPTATPACAEPGVFAYVPPPPAAGPLESAGAHSPTKTAATPPSTLTPSAVQNPAKK